MSSLFKTTWSHIACRLLNCSIKYSVISSSLFFSPSVSRHSSWNTRFETASWISKTYSFMLFNLSVNSAFSNLWSLLVLWQHYKEWILTYFKLNNWWQCWHFKSTSSSSITVSSNWCFGDDILGKSFTSDCWDGEVKSLMSLCTDCLTDYSIDVI